MIAISVSSEPSKPRYLESVMAMNSILEELEALDQRSAQIVEPRVFGGLTEKEIGVALDASLANGQTRLGIRQSLVDLQIPNAGNKGDRPSLILRRRLILIAT